MSKSASLVYQCGLAKGDYTMPTFDNERSKLLRELSSGVRTQENYDKIMDRIDQDEYLHLHKVTNEDMLRPLRGSYLEFVQSCQAVASGTLDEIAAWAQRQHLQFVREQGHLFGGHYRDADGNGYAVI